MSHFITFEPVALIKSLKFVFKRLKNINKFHISVKYLVYDAVTVLKNIKRPVNGWLVNDEMERIGKEAVVNIRDIFPASAEVGLKDITKTLVRAAGILAEIRTRYSIYSADFDKFSTVQFRGM